MAYNIIIAGVGGQGILSIARVISQAALNQGMQVKQAEVHGMSQRGGAVYSHVRISNEAIYSDLIPAGQADMVLALEPLEALRYTQMLRPDGTVVTGTSAVANIAAYPSVEEVLGHVSAFKHHVAIDVDRLGRAAGSTLAANIVALGAASSYLQFTTRALEDAISEVFRRKGERIVETNLRAFRFGRNAALAYLAALDRGLKPSEIRSWIEGMSAEDLASEDFPEAPDSATDSVHLTSGEASAFESVLLEAYDEGRSQLYEHEVYSLLELIGAINAPRHRFIPKGSTIDEAGLSAFPGSRVVLKLVSQDIVHKSDVGAVRFIPKELGTVRKEIEGLIARHSEAARVAGVLLVEYVEHEGGLGSELFVGIRGTREFGPVIAAGLGGLDTEYMASRLKPGRAVAKALALETDADAFLELFKDTVAYEILSGSVRGHDRVVSDAELLRCFRAFIGIARQFCIDRGEEGPDVGELEVNPFAFKDQRLLPLDGRGNLRPAAKAPPVRDRDGIEALLEPQSIVLAGVSEKPGTLGRIVLSKILGAGFDPAKVTILKEGVDEVAGIRCVATVDQLPESTDLIVLTTPAEAATSLVQQIGASGKVKAGIVISGGAGETEQSSELGDALRHAMSDQRPDGKGTVFVGPNCMGLRSIPGKFDTLFVPDEKLAPPTNRPPDPVAILSQSGAFAVSRLSKLDGLNPLFTVSFGNQYDVTLSDLLTVLGDREDVQVAAIYMEGFADLDGLRSVRAVREWTAKGKTVVLYKGGRTASGRSAAAGHTAAVAGDYDICLTAFKAAGAIQANSLDEFNDLLQLSTCLAGKMPSGDHIFAVTNAGMEAVAIADALGDLEETGWLAGLGSDFGAQLGVVLSESKLDSLVAVRNPLDLTPMANELVYDRIVRLALASNQVDAIVVSCVPLAPCLHSLEAQIDHPESFPNLAKSWISGKKPVVFVLDGGPLYDPLIDRLKEIGAPTFRSADAAVRALAKWLGTRAGQKDPSVALV